MEARKEGKYFGCNGCNSFDEIIIKFVAELWSNAFLPSSVLGEFVITTF